MSEEGFGRGTRLEDKIRNVGCFCQDMQKAALGSGFHTARSSHLQMRSRQNNTVLTWGDIGLLTGPHQTSFSEPSSFTIRLSRGERPVLAPEYAVKAPVEVMAEPVSYTKASSYNAATDGLAIYESLATEISSCRGNTCNGDPVVVNMGYFMELFLDLRVLALWPKEVKESAGAFSNWRWHERKMYRLTPHHLDEDWFC